MKSKLTIEKRKTRVRAKIHGTEKMPRLCVYRSNKFVYAQLIDDNKGKTLVSVSEKLLTEKAKTKSEKAKQIGVLIAKKALDAKIKRVVFDKGPYRYHGRIKALAEGAREGGLQF